MAVIVASASNCENTTTAAVGDRFDAKPPRKSAVPYAAATANPRMTAIARHLGASGGTGGAVTTKGSADRVHDAGVARRPNVALTRAAVSGTTGQALSASASTSGS